MSKVLNRIKNQMVKDENSWQAMVLGATGTGKSFTAIKFGELLDPAFNIDRVVFKPEDFLGILNKGIPKHSAIVCDEIGSWLSGRDWMTTQNKLMSLVLETYRFRQLAVIWTVPHARMVDINLRDLCHVIIETIKIDRSEQLVNVKFKYRNVNPLTGKAYEKFPVVREDDGGLKTLTSLKIGRPSKKIERQYLKKKEDHMRKIYEEIESKMNKKTNVGEGKTRRAVQCNDCGHQFFTIIDRPKCSKCNGDAK